VTDQARARVAELRAASVLRTSAPMDRFAQGGAMAIEPDQIYEMGGVSMLSEGDCDASPELG